ncbi:hypothetical protein QFC20_002645 [Naganishia adeliensis]|uniref:Uncharacterized protein n=1 Tax=Naganishia adeliensis TaxID=92952 RepID=A0ACC2WJ82_9TREE|nr:hypothetical protein QFC20_002645 [Naganishia adeliensis]
MPPKKQQQNAPKSKVVVDKTFGLANKGGKKAKTVAQQQALSRQQAGKNPEVLSKEKERELAKKAKEAEIRRKKEEAALFQTAITQPKVPFGVDPKTIMCAFFKAGICEKGSKCKFSHDKNVERKAEKANIYQDTREKEDEKAQDTMDKWDEEKLRSVVTSKGGNPRTTTDILIVWSFQIVCKYFIQAIEDQKYGRDCKYRHALPPGFVLKSEKKAAEEAAKKEVISLEEFLETERHKLKAPLTPVTPESFAIWKKTRMDKRKAEEEAKEKAKQAQRAAGKLTGMSGKDMFAFGTEFLGEEDEEDDDDWDLQQYMANREPAARQEEDDGEDNDLRGDGESDEDDDDDADGSQGDENEDVDGVSDQLQQTSVAA